MQKSWLMRQFIMTDKSNFKQWLLGIVSALMIGIVLIHYEIVMSQKDEQPDLESWYKLGELYEQQGQLPLSLEAFSHVCQTHPIAKQKIKALLKNNRYATVEKGNVFNSESLLVLYDKQRQQALNDRLSDCDLDAIVPPQVEKIIPQPVKTVQPSKCENAKSPVAQLKCLRNPHAQFSVSLWLDKRGKKQFNSHQKVTIGYQINGLKTGTIAYFTLLNVSPNGHLAMIFSEPVEVGKIYGQLTGQSSVATVKQINLEVGQEYFKAMVTSEPIDWEIFIKEAANGKPPVKFWGTVELMVKVK